MEEEWKSYIWKINSRLANSVNPTNVFLLAKFVCVQDGRDYLASLYAQTNSAKRYHLETEIRNAQQGDDSIHAFYVKMTTIWDQLSFMDSQFSCATDSTTLKTYHQETRLVQFLMAIYPKYEHVRSMLLHWSPLPQ